METLALQDGRLSVRVSPAGGALAAAAFDDRPVLRPYGGEEGAPFDPLKSASFPLVPFGNRLEGNAFSYGGEDYSLSSNTPWDPLYLHGDGWVQTWCVADCTADCVILELESVGRPETPYAFKAWQRISVTGEALQLRLGVTNAGDRPLPFGLGHHCYFPLTPQTTLQAPARAHWTEKDGFLPDICAEIPADMDFAGPRRIPRRWVNNGFEGWDGRARIVWPELRLAAEIAAPAFTRYFLFHSDTDFEPDFSDDYFCFEPMTHSANGHNRADLGGLVVLAAGESLDTDMTISPADLA